MKQHELAGRPVPRIFYFCPDDPSRSGGVKVIYRHVDILNENGFSASVVHQKKGFRCDWFEHNTEITWLSEARIQKNDCMVFPEIFGPAACALGPGIRKIIFNQGAYLTFQNQPLNGDHRNIPYLHPDVAGAVVVSDDSRNYLRYTFPDLSIHRVYNAVRPDLFSFCREKKPQIAIMPKQNNHQIQDIAQVVNILRHRGALKNFTLKVIQNKTEAEAARLLRESLFFLSFNYHEGFSLPPAEAMACGCMVIGYHGFGGAEYFHPEHCFPVPTGDIIAFARQTEKAIDMLNTDPDRFHRMRSTAAKTIRSAYSPQRRSRSVCAAWKEILGSE